jgi:Domain of unknown function (DUF4157)
MSESLTLRKPKPEENAVPAPSSAGGDLLPDVAPALADREAPSRESASWLGIQMAPPFALHPAVPLTHVGAMVQAAPDDEGGSPDATPAAAPQEMSSPDLIVDDDVADLAPGQMRKSDFLGLLESAVCRTATEALAGTEWSATGCPYIAYWFQYYAGRDARQVQRAIRLYVPGQTDVADAHDYISIITGHVRDAVTKWAATGEVTGIPDGLPLTEFTAVSPGVQMKGAPHGAAGSHATPERVRGDLGSGQPLDSVVRSRMSEALGADFSRVRVHTDARGGEVSTGLRARALTVGEHVAFAPGQYRPGTLAGDALLAHELAHVVQQGAASGAAPARAGDTSYGALEREADSSSAGAMVALWGRGNAMLTKVARNVRPTISNGLRLQACTDCGSSKKTPDAGPVPPVAPPQPKPEELIKTDLQGYLADNILEPPEWQNLGDKANKLSFYDTAVASLLEHDFDFEYHEARTVALIALDPSPQLQKFRGTFKTKVSGSPKKLESNAFEAFLTQILSDMVLDKDEADAMRRVSFNFETAQTQAAFQKAGITEPTLSTLMALLDMGYTTFHDIAARPSFFPINLKGTKDAGLSATVDMRVGIIQAFTESGAWEHGVFSTVRALLGGLSRADATALLTASGIGQTSARLIASNFTLPEEAYQGSVVEKTLLRFDFEKVGGAWELSSATQQNLQVTWHPTLVSPLAPVGGKVETGKYESETDIGKFKFASGVEENAARLNLTFRGQSFTVLIAESAFFADPTLLDRLDVAFSNIPAKHLAAVKEIRIDPGNDPGGKNGAFASPDGTINIYLSNAGPTVPQAALSETTAHEIGHEVTYVAEKADPKFWDKWDAAIKDDKFAVSRYGLTNHYEDSAETYVLYLGGGKGDAATVARYPHRFAIMDTLF